METVPEFEIGTEIRCYQIGEKEIVELIDFHDNYAIKWNYLFSQDEAQERLSRGHRCYIAVKKVISWVFFGLVPIEFIRQIFTAPLKWRNSL